MRPLEILLAVANLLAVVALAVPLRVRWLLRTAPIALLVAAAQYLFEGWRWQMVPAYALACLFFGAWLGRTLRAGHQPSRRRWGRLLRVGSGVVGLALSVALPMLFPVFRFPHPAGPLGVGTLTYHWVDDGRPEIFTADPKDRRELMVQIWYPARVDSAAPRTIYAKDAPRVLAPLARLLGLPGFFLGYLQYVSTNAVEAAPVAMAELAYPVLILSPGRCGYRQESTLQVEELVSRGYVVAAIDHTYAVSGVVFPDGRLVDCDPRMLDRAFEDRIVPYLAEDAVFTLNQLARLNQADPNGLLTGRLDLRHAGMFGLSLGGEITAEACRRESRLRACLAMDVWMPASVIQAGLEQPTMFITRDAATMRLEGWSQANIDRTWDSLRQVFAHLRGDGCFVQVPGMFHVDFSDASLFAPIITRWLRITGPIDQQRARSIVSAYELAFFDHHLKGQLAPLLDGPPRQYPEILFDTHRH